MRLGDEAGGAFLACDWGTTNLRAWLVGADGAVRAHRDFPLGVSRLKPGEAAARFRDEVRPALGAGDLPALLCGMIGSDLGWTAVPHRDCPADLQTLADGLATMQADGPPVRIVPGLRCPGLDGLDVMRGEETQVLGWLEQDPMRKRGRRLLCHPGTHAKWVVVEDGRVARFLTAMTGELFAVLRTHSVLRSDAPADDEAAFDQGLAAASDGGALAARLFGVRSRVVGGAMAAQAAPSYLSGLLIGAEVAALPGLLGAGAEEPVALLGDPALCRWYERALRRRGMDFSVHDGDAAALAGLKALNAMGA